MYSSYKDIGARMQDDLIVSLLPDDTNPRISVIQSFSGGILSYQDGGLSLSGTVNYSSINMDFVDENTKPMTGSVAMSYSYESYMVFAESAYSNSRHAHLVGIRNSFQRFTQLLTYRYIENDYNADFANFMSNSANQTNEKGLFYKVEFRNREFMIQTFADLFENIEPHVRYLDRNQGVSWGVRGEIYSGMTFGASYREKRDKDWRNLSGITQYENRKREYVKMTWQQTNTRFLTTRLVWDYQQREYPDYDILNTGYALSQSVRMQFRDHRVSFTVGVFETEIPLYLYLYAGRINNPLIILSGEGQFAMVHTNYGVGQRLQVELMCSFLKRDVVEYTASMMIGWRL